MTKKSNIAAISDSKIRIVIWKLKNKKTKKECCEFLKITYNTTRLNTIIEDFKRREKLEIELKLKNKNKIFTNVEIKSIINDYTKGEGISNISTRYFVSFPRIKKLLLENNIPIRAKGYKKSTDVSHIVQDLDIKFSIGDRVFIPGPDEEEYINKNKALVKVKNTYGEIYEVFDEDYIDYIKKGYIKEKTLYPGTILKEDKLPIKGIHYETYWYLNNGICWGKLDSLERHLKMIEEHIINYGREFYRVWIDGKKKYNGFYIFKRNELFPIISNNL